VDNCSIELVWAWQREGSGEEDRNGARRRGEVAEGILSGIKKKRRGIGVIDLPIGGEAMEENEKGQRWRVNMRLWRVSKNSDAIGKLNKRKTNKRPLLRGEYPTGTELPPA